MIDWLDRLSGSLLTGGSLDFGQITALRTLFDEINIDWHAVTGDKHFPSFTCFAIVRSSPQDIEFWARFRSPRSSRITPPSKRSCTR